MCVYYFYILFISCFKQQLINTTLGSSLPFLSVVLFSRSCSGHSDRFGGPCAGLTAAAFAHGASHRDQGAAPLVCSAVWNVLKWEIVTRSSLIVLIQPFYNDKRKNNHWYHSILLQSIFSWDVCSRNSANVSSKFLGTDCFYAVSIVLLQEWSSWKMHLVFLIAL